MVIYIAIWKDRHSDTTAHPFYSKKRAIKWAKKKAKECASDGDYQERDCGKGDGWLFYAEYSCEGDCIYVVETLLDKEI